MSTTIEFDRLSKSFGTTLAVDDLTAVVRPGVVTAFLGPNGSGKTTTLRALLGLVAPTSGSATFGGIPYSRLEHPAREVGAVLEATGFHPGRRAREHLRVLGTAAGIDEGRVDDVLEEVGLTAAAGRRVTGLSLAMPGIFGLAAAPLGETRVIILD